ncbi:MAG: hypothetical protein HC830_09480 [Bacteroidetes bacterium]|nr:hypothetical protein [Bacteroidota bacterium]
MKKVFISGTIAAVCMIAVSIVVGLIFNQLFPSVKAEYDNMNVFRAMNDPLMYIYFIEPFILSFVLAWIWNRTMMLFKGSVAKRAFLFFIHLLDGSLTPRINNVCFFV